MAAPWWLPFGRVPELAPDELWSLVQDRKVQVVDVRSALEYRKSRIEGALHLPITTFASEWRTLRLTSRKPIAAICLSAHRSIPAVRVLREAGIEESYQLAGGMLAWWKAGLPTISG